MSSVAERAVALRLPSALRLLFGHSSPPPDATAVRSRPAVLSTAETADCTCPEFCERDHDAE